VLGSRYFSTDEDRRLSEEADIDPYSLVQKDLDTLADSIKKVIFSNIFKIL